MLAAVGFSQHGTARLNTSGAATKRESDGPTRGKTVDSVRQAFASLSATRHHIERRARHSPRPKLICFGKWLLRPARLHRERDDANPYGIPFEVDRSLPANSLSIGVEYKLSADGGRLQEVAAQRTMSISEDMYKLLLKARADNHIVAVTLDDIKT
jgi:hypothetical protein